ncbi:hypothetical protein CDD83_7965 [Cordyceps sp. RAO-2017]|nr:hypothetical protein CDD83_7965 [Cordyceps sp. RAO-2017]
MSPHSSSLLPHPRSASASSDAAVNFATDDTLVQLAAACTASPSLPRNDAGLPLCKLPSWPSSGFRHSSYACCARSMQRWGSHGCRRRPSLVLLVALAHLTRRRLWLSAARMRTTPPQSLALS